MSQFFTSDGQSTGISASASVRPMNIQGWFPLGLTGLISMLSMRLSGVFSSITVWKHQFFRAHLSLWSCSHIRTWLLEIPWLWLYGPLSCTHPNLASNLTLLKLCRFKEEKSIYYLKSFHVSKEREEKVNSLNNSKLRNLTTSEKYSRIALCFPILILKVLHLEKAG